MNRSERNVIREATTELAQLAARVAELEAERDRLASSNRWLRGRLNGLLRRQDAS